MNQKADKRKRGDTSSFEISEPYAFRHDLHIGNEVYDERRVDTSMVASGTYCQEPSSDVSVTNLSLSNVIENEVIPAIRSEIADMVENRLRQILNEHKEYSTHRHCSTCLCVGDNVYNQEKGQTSMKESENATSERGSELDDLHEDFYRSPGKVQAKTEAIEREQKEVKPFRRSMHAYTSFGKDGKLLKYGSDIHIAKSKQVETEQYLDFTRTKTLPVSANRMGTRSLIQMSYHKDFPLSKSDERQCLADALQWHVEDLIDGIVFKDSELPDDLLGDSCLTDEECSCLRKTLDRKNQVRVLISTIRGRDLNILKRFLKHIKAQNESVATNIEKKFEENKRNGVRCSECALCNLTSNVNLKYIADRLWRYNLIEVGLYNWITNSDRPTGVQGEFWRAVINSLNVRCKRDASCVSGILAAALTKNNHYEHVAKGIVQMIKSHGELGCHCQLRPNTMQSAGSFLSLQSSRSPRSSEFDIDFKCEVATSQFDSTSVKRFTNEDMSEIKPEQELQDQHSLTDDMKQFKRISQNIMTTETNTAQIVERGELSSRDMSPSDLHQTNGDRMYATTNLCDTNVPHLSKDNVVADDPVNYMITQKDENTIESIVVSKRMPEENEGFSHFNFSSEGRARCTENQKDENAEESLVMSKIIQEENNDSTTQQNFSCKDQSKSYTRSTFDYRESNATTRKDENFKPPVPDKHIKAFNAHGRHIILIRNNELESSDV